MKFNVTNYEGGNREEKKQAINNSSESSSRFSGSDTDSEYERAFEDRIQQKCDENGDLTKHNNDAKEDECNSDAAIEIDLIQATIVGFFSGM